MRRMLPSRLELVVLAALAVICAGMLIWFANSDLVLAAAVFPVILAAMLMGARRGGQLSGERRPGVHGVQGGKST
ncbi:MAG: hypothetical protein ACM359_02215 [Bacillota bacterium]